MQRVFVRSSQQHPARPSPESSIRFNCRRGWENDRKLHSTVRWARGRTTQRYHTTIHNRILGGARTQSARS